MWPPSSPDSSPMDFCVVNVEGKDLVMLFMSVLVPGSNHYNGNQPKYPKISFVTRLKNSEGENRKLVD